jgi:hypothetical protein
MRTKLLFFGLLASILLVSCEDDVSTMGTSLQPDRDKMQTFDTIVGITASTVKVDSVYAKTINGSLGEYYDPSFGTLNAGFACEFYPASGFYKIDSIIGGKVDSVQLHLAYTYIGDSLAPMQMTIYPITTSLTKNYYTNVNPASFCDLNNPITRYGYTARNLEIPDSVVKELGYSSYNLYVPLPQQFGQDFLEAVTADSSIVTNLDLFREKYKGFYIANTFGTGSMLCNISTEVYFYYTLPTKTADGLSDSTYRAYAIWAVTKEVVQLNSFSASKLPYFNAIDSVDYIISPAGVYTELAIPIKDIVSGVGEKQYATVSLALNTYKKDEWEYTLPFPGRGTISGDLYSKLLLIPPDSVTSFFENQEVAGKYAATTTLSASDNVYYFDNISTLINYADDNNIDTLKLWAIPVQTTFTSSSTSSVEYSTAYDLTPAGVKLKTTDDNLKIRVVASTISK